MNLAVLAQLSSMLNLLEEPVHSSQTKSNMANASSLHSLHRTTTHSNLTPNITGRVKFRSQGHFYANLKFQSCQLKPLSDLSQPAIFINSRDSESVRLRTNLEYQTSPCFSQPSKSLNSMIRKYTNLLGTSRNNRNRRTRAQNSQPSNSSL